MWAGVVRRRALQEQATAAAPGRRSSCPRLPSTRPTRCSPRRPPPTSCSCARPCRRSRRFGAPATAAPASPASCRRPRPLHRARDGKTAGTLWAGIQDGGGAAHLYTSVDAGKTLTLLGLNLPGVLVADIVKLAGGRLVVGTRDGSGGLRGKNNTGSLYYSDDEGAHWTAGHRHRHRCRRRHRLQRHQRAHCAHDQRCQRHALHQRRRHAWTAGFHHRRHRPPADKSATTPAATRSSCCPTHKLLPVDRRRRLLRVRRRPPTRRRSASAPVPLSRSSITSRSPSTPPTPATSSSATPAAARACSRPPTAAACGSWRTTASSRSGSDCALKSPCRLSLRRPTAPASSTSAAPRSTRRGLASIAPSDVTRDPVVGAHVRHRRRQARRRRAVEPGRPGAPCRLLPDATQTGDDMAPFAHNAWTTLTYPDAGKAPVDGAPRRRHHHVRRRRKKSQYAGGRRLPLHLDERRHELERGRRSRSSAACARSPSTRRSTPPSTPAPATSRTTCAHVAQRRRAVEVDRRRRPLLAHLDVVDTALDGEAPRTIVVDPARAASACGSSAITLNSTSGSDGDIFESLDGGTTWATITPSNGVLRLHLLARRGAARVLHQRRQRERLREAAGQRLDAWSPGASASTATRRCCTRARSAPAPATGLFEASGVMISADDMGIRTTMSAATTMMLPVDDVDGGGNMPRAAAAAAASRRPTGAAAVGPRARRVVVRSR